MCRKLTARSVLPGSKPAMATAVARWRPFAEIEDLRKRLDRVFEDMGNGRAREWSLAIDLIDRDDHYVLRADVPGLKPDEVKIEVEDDVLTVSAEHEEREEEKKDNYVRRERHYGAFSRSVTLPKGCPGCPTSRAPPWPFVRWTGIRRPCSWPACATGSSAASCEGLSAWSAPRCRLSMACARDAVGVEPARHLLRRRRPNQPRATTSPARRLRGARRR